jgi:hypothetical protein
MSLCPSQMTKARTLQAIGHDLAHLSKNCCRHDVLELIPDDLHNGSVVEAQEMAMQLLGSLLRQKKSGLTPSG